jgi:hypothetical protein
MKIDGISIVGSSIQMAVQIFPVRAICYLPVRGRGSDIVAKLMLTTASLLTPMTAALHLVFS